MSGRPMADHPDIYGRQATEVRKLMGDLPIVEAKEDFIVYVTTSDQEKGVPGDPNNCMFSLACKRAFGSRGVLFFPTVAYVDMIDPDDQNRRIIMRFRLPTETRTRLEQFDKETQGARAGFHEATFRLRKVTKSYRLGARKTRQRNDRRRKNHTPDPVLSARAKKSAETRRNRRLMGVRSGVGLIHTEGEGDADE
jgi:hypothetical protein